MIDDDVTLEDLGVRMLLGIIWANVATDTFQRIIATTFVLGTTVQYVVQFFQQRSKK